MDVANQLMPLGGQYEAFFAGADDGPIVMLNLLKLRERAAYPDGDRGLTGAQAYAIYGREVLKLIARNGGRLIHGGRVSGVLVGEVEDLWDSAALIEYPSNAAFRAMMESDEYQAIAIHRAAGLAGQLDIRIERP